MASSGLTFPQICLGFSRAELTNEAGTAGLDLVIDIGGTNYTVELGRPSSGNFYRNDRLSTAADMSLVLRTALNDAETAAATGATWTRTWDHNEDGYLRYLRSAGGVVTIEFDHADTSDKIDPRWWGFDPAGGNPATGGGTAIDSDFQVRRLWMPREWPKHWSKRTTRSVELSRRIDRKVRRHKYSSGPMWVIEFEDIDALLIYKDRSSKSWFFPAWATAIAADDPNVSFEGGIWEDLFATDAPLYWFPDKDANESYEVELYRQEDFEDLEAIFSEVDLDPNRADVTFMFQEYVP